MPERVGTIDIPIEPLTIEFAQRLRSVIVHTGHFIPFHPNTDLSCQVSYYDTPESALLPTERTQILLALELAAALLEAARYRIHLERTGKKPAPKPGDHLDWR